MCSGHTKKPMVKIFDDKLIKIILFCYDELDEEKKISSKRVDFLFTESSRE